MFTDPSQTVDSFVTKQVTEFLFTINPPITRSMDLIALNIQRGRDHGIPGIPYIILFLQCMVVMFGLCKL